MNMTCVALLAAVTVQVGGMSESPYVEKTVETIKAEGLGDYTVLFVGPWTGEKIRKVGDSCREHKMKFVMDETVNRLTGKVRSSYQDHLAGSLAALKEYQDVFDGSLLLCEFGGLMFNWPESTVHNAATKPPPAETFSECATNTVLCMRKTIATAKELGVPGPYVCIEPTGGVAPSYVYRAGIDRIDLEVVYNDDLERRYASVVGATKAVGKSVFGVDMAMVWYGGNQHDRLWESRWRTSLFHAFIRGANPIYAEHGLMNYQALGKDYDTDHPEVRRFRRCVGEVAAYAKAHPRPDGLPRAAVAGVLGRLDGYAGGWQTHLWGQRTDDRYLVGEADYAWEIFDSLYRRRSWENREKFGDTDYSGNPPLGAADLIPDDAPQATFDGYKTLFFLGRNSMDDALYAKLVAYVKQGGTLLLAASHLGTANRPTDGFIPYNGGDWTELTGVRASGGLTNMPYGLKFCAEPPCGWRFPLWSANCDPKYTDGGFAMPVLENVGAQVLAVASDRFVDKEFKPEMLPVLFAKKLGKGTVVFLPSIDPPWAHGVRALYEFLVKSALEAVDVWPKVACSDRVRWSVYGDEKLYLLNTEEDLAQEAVVRISKGSPELRIRLAAGEIREIDLKSAGIGRPCLQNPTADSVEVAWSVSGLSYGAVEVADNPEMRGARRFAAPQAGLQRPERRLVRVRLANLPHKPLWYRTVTTPVVEYVDCYTFKLGEPVKGEVGRLVLPRADGSSHFAVINDTHDFREPVKRVFEKVKELNPALLVWNGDIVKSLESEDEAVRTVIDSVGAEGYASSRPCLYTMGNHEYRGTWSQHLDSVMPTGSAAIRCGDVAIVTLDTGEPIPDDDPAWHGHAAFGPLFAEQTKWLEEALKRPDVASAPFLVAICHVPIADEKGNIVKGLEGWAKLLDEAGAQLVIAGHTHIPRYDAPSASHRWAQVVGGGPILGEFEGDKGHMDLPDFFPTVIDADVKGGRLEVVVHDLWRRRIFGRYSLSGRVGRGER